MGEALKRLKNMSILANLELGRGEPSKVVRPYFKANGAEPKDVRAATRDRGPMGLGSSTK